MFDANVCYEMPLVEVSQKCYRYIERVILKEGLCMSILLAYRAPVPMQPELTSSSPSGSGFLLFLRIIVDDSSLLVILCQSIPRV